MLVARGPLPGALQIDVGISLLVLLIANIPTYLVIGWLIFDTGDAAADSMVDAMKLFVRIVYRGFRGWRDDPGAMMKCGLLLVICAAVITAEHWMLVRYNLAPSELNLGLPIQWLLE